jgi:hypothetical protein
MVVTKSITAQNTFSDPITTFTPQAHDPITRGFINLSLSGTWAATVFLQRSFDRGATWLDVASYTANTERAIEDYEPNVFYRAGVKTGGFTSGTVVVRLSNAGQQ